MRRIISRSHISHFIFTTIQNTPWPSRLVKFNLHVMGSVVTLVGQVWLLVHLVTNTLHETKEKRQERWVRERLVEPSPSLRSTVLWLQTDVQDRPLAVWLCWWCCEVHICDAFKNEGEKKDKPTHNTVAVTLHLNKLSNSNLTNDMSSQKTCPWRHFLNTNTVVTNSRATTTPVQVQK